MYGVVGDRFENMPIPLREDATEFITVGALALGVEGRAIDPAIVSDELGELTAEQWAVIKENQPANLDDSGPSIHVLDAASRVEHLRFDCFDNGPHYHYVLPDEGYQIVVTMDRAACGDPIDFAIGCLENRIRPMLEAAGRRDLAELVDDGLVREALPKVEALARQASLA